MYKAIIPAADWFYFLPKNGNIEKIIQPLAGFALTDNGDIVGLFPISGDGDNPPRLVTPPALRGGRYVTRDQLDTQEMTVVRNKNNGPQSELSDDLALKSLGFSVKK